MALDPKYNKGQSPEELASGITNKPGVYRHEGSGVEHISLSAPASDALVLQGFEYVGPAPRATASTKAKTTQPGSTDTKAAKDLQKQIDEANAAKEAAEQKAAEAEARAERAQQDADVAQNLAEEAEAARQAAESALAASGTNPDTDKEGR